MSESISDTSLDAVSDTPSDLSEESLIPKPGGLLKGKRLENEWTKDDVAETLLLSVQHVEALENDEYDKLPCTTYVIGYWRSYANLLRIDISESIEFHKNNLEVSPSAIVLEGGHRRAHNHQENVRKRSGLVFFVLSVMFLAGIWYWQNPDDNLLDQWFGNRAKTNINNGDNQVISGEGTPAIRASGQDDFVIFPEPNFSDDITNSVTVIAVGEESGATTERVNNGDSQDASLRQQEQKVAVIQLAPTQSIEKEIEKVIVTSEKTNAIEGAGVIEKTIETSEKTSAIEGAGVIEKTIETSEKTSAIEGTGVIEKTIETSEKTSAIEGTGVIEKTIVTSEKTSAIEGAGVIEKTIEKTIENVSEAATENPVADSPNWIFIRVEKESWLDVRDVLGEKLIYRTAKAGESISLKGVPPFFVFIDIADGVQVEYLGKPVRFKVDENNLSVRFRVDQSGTKTYQ